MFPGMMGGMESTSCSCRWTESAQCHASADDEARQHDPRRRTSSRAAASVGRLRPPRPAAEQVFFIGAPECPDRPARPALIRPGERQVMFGSGPDVFVKDRKDIFNLRVLVCNRLLICSDPSSGENPVSS